MKSLYRKDVLGILYSPDLYLPEPPQIMWNHRKMSLSFSQCVTCSAFLLPFCKHNPNHFFPIKSLYRKDVLGILYSPDVYLPEPPQILWNHRKMSMSFSQCVTCSAFLLPFCKHNPNHFFPIKSL
ncbi:hypothetical protein XELAEV_18019535mg [Xenopus laevis]|uniref:Uncharacterized protein n=1 Tax=Xenopus laevis TaxID=8355 RepID=A0A974HUU1_XENLA|nr:hypothetical protein XELAEV_18019535mg [Xenopus laevis]